MVYNRVGRDSFAYASLIITCTHLIFMHAFACNSKGLLLKSLHLQIRVPKACIIHVVDNGRGRLSSQNVHFNWYVKTQDSMQRPLACPGYVQHRRRLCCSKFTWLWRACPDTGRQEGAEVFTNQADAWQDAIRKDLQARLITLKGLSGVGG